MSVIRVHKNKNFTVMSNVHLRDMDLSLKAKGLLSVMLSLPDNWNYSIAGLCSICKENETAIKSTIKELKERRYVIVDKKYPNQTESKKYEYVYNIFEEPQPEKQEVEKQEVENLPIDNLPIENHHLNKGTDIPSTDKSSTDGINIDRLNTKKEDKTLSNDNGEAKTSSFKKQGLKKEANELFERVWKLYPKKIGKGQVSDTQKLKLLKIGYDELERAVKRCCQYNKDRDMQYWQNGSTFFNSGYVDFLDENYAEHADDNEKAESSFDAKFDDTCRNNGEQMDYKTKLKKAKEKAAEIHGEEYREKFWEGMDDLEVESYLGLFGIFLNEI